MTPDLLAADEVVYPESDGRPMGENTLQMKWIVTLYNGFEALFRPLPDVFVAGDLFWYPVRGEPTTVQAPDLMIAFGRPKGERGSYRQWDEGGVAPQVVFEVLSPSNGYREMQRKFAFYERHGVEEYYVYDPEWHALDVWMRTGAGLRTAGPANGFVSPRTGVRFEIPGDAPMRVVRPDGLAFDDYYDILRRAEDERQRAVVLAAKLRELGIDPDTL